ncbi:MAG: ATP-binding protein [Proteobacteria bacterium]|nr:ATP-binding protein [Pseudomonadota bacterium]
MIKWGLNIKFIFMTVFLIVFISLMFSIILVYQSRKALLYEFSKRGQSLVQNLALNAELPLLLENKATLSSLVQNLMRENDVQRVRIVNEVNSVLVDITKNRKLWLWQEERITYPVYLTPEAEKTTSEDMSLFLSSTPPEGTGQARGQRIGTIEVLFSREGIIATLNRIRWWIFFSATIATVIGGLGALYFSYTLIRPIQKLARATSSIARGNWEERLDESRDDELGALTESFNIMASSLVKKKQELESTYRELAQKERMAEIGKFSMMIAHELKNPIGIIKGSVDILSKRDTERTIKQTMLGYIQDEIKRLNRLIDDFLSFARPQPPQKATCDINRVIERVAAHFMIPENSSKQLTIHQELGTLPLVKIDEHQLYQALLNLLTNAAQAIEQRGDIYFKTDHFRSWLRIQVSDTGMGIPDTDRAKVFDPFFTTNATGTGLGLSIVKKIVDNHGGQVQLSDYPGGGATFTILLPV